MTSAPAGWYDDGHGSTRYWDGLRWTEHSTPLPRSARRRPVWPWAVGGAVVGVIALGSVVAGAIALGSAVGRDRATPAVGPGDTVLAYNTAWNEHDCSGVNSTTVDALDYADDCTEFDQQSAEYTDYHVSVMTQSVDGGGARVVTSESFHIDGGVHLAQVEYLLENHGGVWQISSIGEVD